MSYIPLVLILHAISQEVRQELGVQELVSGQFEAQHMADSKDFEPAFLEQFH